MAERQEMDLNVALPMSPEPAAGSICQDPALAESSGTRSVASPPPVVSPEPEPEPGACSICLDPVLAASPGTKSVASLQCGHTFHLDCIGSAFNAKGIMQCPNCRHTEDGNWLSANGLQPDSDSQFGNGVTGDPHQIISAPLQGSNINRMIIRSATAEAQQLLSELLRQPAVDGSIPLNSVFQNLELRQSISYHTTGMEGDPTADLRNTQVDRSESRNSNIGIPMVDFGANRPTAPFGFELPRYDGANQRHSTQPTPGSGSSYVAPLGASPALTTSRDHGRPWLMRGHVIRQTTRSTPYPAISRRIIRPRAVSIATSIAASYRSQDVEPHSIYRASTANVQNIIHNQDNASRRADLPYTYLGQWGPTAESGTVSSQHNQGNSSLPSGSTSQLPPELRPETGYYMSPQQPSDRRHSFM